MTIAAISALAILVSGIAVSVLIAIWAMRKIRSEAKLMDEMAKRLDREGW